MAIPMKQRTFVGSGGTGMMIAEVVVKDGVVGVALSAVSTPNLLVLGVRFEWQIEAENRAKDFSTRNRVQ